MKGPHFFEKRKKEMARQEKLKQKADRKAQRKAEKDRGDGTSTGEDSDELTDVDGLSPGLGVEGAGSDGDTSDGESDGRPGAEVEERQPSVAGGSGDQVRGS